MNIVEAQKKIMMCAETGDAIMLDSSSGMGKSEMAGWQTFCKLQAADPNTKWGYGVVFAATQSPADLMGYLFKADKKFVIDGEEIIVPMSDPTCPLWMMGRSVDSPVVKPAWMFDRFYLLIDEYGQGDGDTKRAMAEIFLNGGTTFWRLPNGSMRVACTNLGKRYGVTTDFDFAIARRYQVHVDGDVDLLVDYLDKPYNHQGRSWLTTGFTKAWAKNNADKVFEKEPEKQGPWCNPRSLCAIDRHTQIETKYNNGAVPVDSVSYMEMLAGRVGMPTARAYIQDLRAATELPQYEQVVADPANTAVPAKADQLMVQAYIMASRTLPEHAAQVIQYIQRMPKDFAITYVSALTRRDYAKFINLPAMQAWIKKNAALVSIISSLTH